MEFVILVDNQDNEHGIMEKMEAHRKGALHRAISVFLFNSKKELLLQQRASGKYHSANLWTNTCCSHPRPGETNREAAERRLKEEMGMNCNLQEKFSFVYEARFIDGLIEHEYDHVFTGISDDIPVPDPMEVNAWKYMSIADIKHDINNRPDQYTEWFKICMSKWEQQTQL